MHLLFSQVIQASKRQVLQLTLMMQVLKLQHPDRHSRLRQITPQVAIPEQADPLAQALPDGLAGFTGQGHTECEE